MIHHDFIRLILAPGAAFLVWMCWISGRPWFDWMVIVPTACLLGLLALLFITDSAGWKT